MKTMVRLNLRTSLSLRQRWSGAYLPYRRPSGVHLTNDQRYQTKTNIS